MKILLVHNSYQQLGGEDSVVRLEKLVLDLHGDQAILHQVSNEAIDGFLARLKTALGVVFSISTYFSMRKLLRINRPDVVHVHNFFPLISPAVFYACSSESVPVVFTLHNYRIVCPTALLMHDGAVTERSLLDGPWWAIKHRVYRGSLIGTFLLSLMIFVHLRIGTWRNKVDRFIVLTQFARTRFALAGIPLSSMTVKPNFVDIGTPIESVRSGLLFVGRLSPEKGIDVLLEAANRLAVRNQLKFGEVAVAGTGPLAREVARSNVLSLGMLSSDAVKTRMQSTTALLLPSIWYEGFPMVLVEAFANGSPVIASRLGALAELVEDGVTGLLFNPGDAEDLASKMAWALQHPDEMRLMGNAARACYEAFYSPERNYGQLMSIYREAIKSSNRKQQK